PTRLPPHKFPLRFTSRRGSPRASFLGRKFDEFGGMCFREIRRFESGENPRDLGQPFGALEGFDADVVAGPPYGEVAVRERGDLRQVRDDEDLMGSRQFRETASEVERSLT